MIMHAFKSWVSWNLSESLKNAVIRLERRSSLSYSSLMLFARHDRIVFFSSPDAAIPDRVSYIALSSLKESLSYTSWRLI